MNQGLICSQRSDPALFEHVQRNRAERLKKVRDYMSHAIAHRSVLLQGTPFDHELRRDLPQPPAPPTQIRDLCSADLWLCTCDGGGHGSSDGLGRL